MFEVEFKINTLIELKETYSITSLLTAIQWELVWQNQMMVTLFGYNFCQNALFDSSKLAENVNIHLNYFILLINEMTNTL